MPADRIPPRRQGRRATAHSGARLIASYGASEERALLIDIQHSGGGDRRYYSCEGSMGGSRKHPRSFHEGQAHRELERERHRLTPLEKKAASFDLRSIRWRPGGRGDDVAVVP